jgi:prepilin-type processing-associated H-X9-DG protein
MSACDGADLVPNARNPEGLHVINERCLVRTQAGTRLVVVSGVPVAHYKVGDGLAEAYAMVQLIQQGWCDQNDLARAFGCSTRSLRRYQRQFEAGGLAALQRREGYPKGRSRLAQARIRLLERLKTQGQTNRAIARRLGVSEAAVRKALRRLGWKEAPITQRDLPFQIDQGANPNLSAFFAAAAENPPRRSFDTDPTDRGQDRLMARLGLLDDAAPLFGSSPNVPHAGVLLAVPALIASGIFNCAERIYGSLGPAFFGLRTTLLTLLCMALWRIKRPEGLKEHSPAELGRVLGVDRAPEVKTLRRKLARLANCQRAAQLGQALAQERVARHGQALGFLYVDGHVRVYHGKHRLPKAHVARMRLSMPATTDYWINDSRGDPLFVVTAEVNAGLVKMFPSLLPEVRRLVGMRSVTFVFDRGGYSPKLFTQILAASFDLITYRKGRYPHIPRRAFTPHQARIDGRRIAYVLADQEVRLLQGKLRLRQVTRLMDNGHQTPILTSRRDLAAARVAYHMFERWRQENFFKYLRQEFALDALAQYAVEPDDPTREIPNPKWAAVDAQLRQAYARLDRLQAEYGLEAFTNLEERRRTMRGFKTAQSRIGRQIWKALERVEQLEAQHKKIPRRLPIQSVTSEPVVKLAPEIQHLTNLVKMVAYQAESDLLRIVAPHYHRAEDEGRTLIQNALASSADLKVTSTELRLTLAPLSSPHRTRAIAAVCEALNLSNTQFPGSSLRLCYAVRAET